MKLLDCPFTVSLESRVHALKIPLPPDQRLATALASILVILLIIGAGYWAWQQTNVARQAVHDSLVITRAGQTLDSDLLVGQLGLHDFVAAGDESFAAEFAQRTDRMKANLAVLQSARLSSASRRQLEQLTPELLERWNDIELIIRARDNQAAGVDQFIEAQLQKLNSDMPRVHAGMLDFLLSETGRLTSREAAFTSSMGDLSKVMTIVAGLALVLLATFSWLIARSVRNRVQQTVHRETLQLLTQQEALNGELKLSNAKLRISETNLEITLNSIGDGVLVTDVNACVTRINRVAEKLTSWSEAEAVGRPIGEIFRILKKETREVAVSPVVATLAYGTVQGLTNHTILIARDGTERDIADSCAAIRNNENEIVGAVLIFRDVSGEYLAQQAIRAASARIQAILNTVVDGILTIDTDTDQIESVNPAIEHMFGYSAQELLGKDFRRLIPELDQGKGGVSLEYASVGDGVSSNALGREYVGHRKDGSVFPVEMAVSEMRMGNKRLLTGVLRDITARKLLDQILLDNNRELQLARSAADAANLAKSEFLSNMSHELRTPLSAILGFAQLIDTGVPPPTAVQKRSVDQILKAGWYLLELINEVLDLALVESGKLQLSMEPILLSGILQECQDMTYPQAAERNISMVFNTGTVPLFVFADRVRLMQILLNLLSNAIKYNKRQGAIVVDCSPAENGRLRIRVRDTGEGLADEQLAQLFQPFNRLGQETQGEEGTGIGLVVSKRLVEMMNGSIGAESSVGTGSVFWIELDLYAQPALDFAKEETTGSDAPNRPPATDTPTLLYVEDNPANRMLVEDLLSRRPNIRLLTANTGNSGVDMARALLPDVILMDINLPGISGLEALKILSGDPATAQIPVIALSANAMPGDIRKGLDAGFHRYLTKPIKVLELLATLDETFEMLSSRPTTRSVDLQDADEC